MEMDPQDYSDSEFETEESESDQISQGDYEAYKSTAYKNRGENIFTIEVRNEEQKIDMNDETMERIREVVVEIKHDNVDDTFYTKIISQFRNIQAITFNRECQFMTNTKCLKLILSILRNANLQKLQRLKINIPVKEVYTEGNFEANDYIWDEEEVAEDDAFRTKRVTRSGTKQNSTKTKEQEKEEKSKLVKSNKYALFRQILETILKSFQKLTELSFIMNSFFSVDFNSKDEYYFYSLFKSFCTIIENNASTLQAFHLNAFQWGFFNRNLLSSQFDLIVQSISKINPTNLRELTLDFGRWGCEDYKNYKIFTDKNVTLLASVLENFKNLNFLELNFRSWAYNNQQISDVSIVSLFNSISLMSKLQVLNIEVSRWKYQNESITDESIKCIAYTLLQLKKLRYLALSLKTWQITLKTELENLLRIFQSTLFLSGLRKEPKIIIDDYYYYNLNEQLIKIKDASKRQIQENKKRFYMLNAIQTQYQNTFRQEIIWHMVALCSNYDYDQMGKELRELTSYQNVNFTRSWF